jgi:hypothetical protein
MNATTRRKPPTVPTPPGADARALGMTIIEAAVDHYWASRARRHEGYRRYQAAQAAMDAAGMAKDASYTAATATVGLACAAASPDLLGGRKGEIRVAAIAYEAAQVRYRDMLRQWDQLDGTAPGSVAASYEIVKAFERGPWVFASRESWQTRDRLDEAIRHAGYRAAIVGGLLYLALEEEEHQEEEHMGLPVNLLVNLDAEKGGAFHEDDEPTRHHP